MSQQTRTAPLSAETSLVPKRHLPLLRRELEHERQFRLDQLEELYAEAAASADNARREVTRALIVAAQWALGDINAALHRLDRGTYGICERCGAPIPFERLEILPMTRLCVQCQNNGPAWPADRAGW
jgi:RNA polymerase-binding protein DksA